MRKYEKEGNLNWNTAKQIISGDMIQSTGKVKPFKLQLTIISKYFNPNEGKKAVEKTIEHQNELKLINMSDVKVTEVKWLWKPPMILAIASAMTTGGVLSLSEEPLECNHVFYN